MAVSNGYISEIVALIVEHWAPILIGKSVMNPLMKWKITFKIFMKQYIVKMYCYFIINKAINWNF